MKDVKTPLLINPIIICQNNNEPFSFLIGTIGRYKLFNLEGNIYRCNFSISNFLKNDHIFSNSSGVVWRNSVKRLLENFTEDQILEIKKETEKNLKNKDVIEINPEEFFKTKPDINKIYKNALKSNFEKHISVVKCICFHYYIKNVFLSTSYDGSLRIYHYTQVIIFHFFSQNTYYLHIWIMNFLHLQYFLLIILISFSEEHVFIFFI